MSVQGQWDDAEAVARIGSDPEAAGVLYDRYVRKLIVVLARQSGNPEVALDAAQETFARLLASKRPVRVNAEGSLWPWLVVTGRNLVYDWRRRGQVDAAARARLGIATRHASGESLDDSLERSDAARLRRPLVAALAGLPEAQRSAVTRRVVCEQTYAEIAASADATEETVRRRVSRGLRTLSATLIRRDE
jgi:RNA polymerase sigma-70 factor, ECF subfamily